jgi:DNA-binding MarR family transcriptional regulator
MDCPRARLPRVKRNQRAAEAFTRLFPELYLRFHRRSARRDQLGPQAFATLSHLAWAGPLTVSELGRHLGRAQSVASEIIDGLTRRDFVERQQDGRDRRKTLVWLTDQGQAYLARERQVLDGELVAKAFSKLKPSGAEALVEALKVLTDAPPKPEAKPRRRR